MGKRLLFHLQINLDVSMGRRNIYMPEPALDNGKFHPRLQKMHRCCVTEGVGTHPLFCQLWTRCSGGSDSRGDDVIDAKPGQWHSPRVLEDPFTRVAPFYVLSQDGGGFRPQGYLSGLLPLAGHNYGGW